MSSTARLIPEPNCPCFQNPEARVIMATNAFTVAAEMTNAFFEACSESGLCREGAILAMHEVIIGMATTLATCHAPAIETGSEESRWETEALLRGIEERLIESLRVKHAVMAAMSPEEIAETIRNKKEYFERGGR